MAPLTSTDPAPPILTIIIRFASSIPDLPIPIPSPSSANAATLRQHIRPHLRPTLSACPLRLIYAGALLPTTTPLSISLRLPQAPAPAPRNGPAAAHPLSPAPQQLYVHCSIATDTSLTPVELDAEVRAGALHSSSGPASTTQRNNYDAVSSNPNSPDTDSDPTHETATPSAATGTRRSNRHAPHSTSLTHHTSPPPTLPPPPQGFDRLLSAGLTPPEVASLRSRFLAIQSHTHTPDTMPTASEMRVLEERWLDNDSTNTNTTAFGAGDGGMGGAGAGGGAEGGGFTDDSEQGGLEDMLWGNVMGFFWAVGGVVWLMREEGVWSKRRQIGVVTGVLVNLAFCFLRVGG